MRQGNTTITELLTVGYQREQIFVCPKKPCTCLIDGPQVDCGMAPFPKESIKEKKP